MSEESKWIQELEDKARRDAFVSSQMSIPLSFQIIALREQRGMTQKQLAEKAGMLQPRIAAMERPSGSEPNLRTLKRLASAFDVALIVRFAPFSELVEWVEKFSPDTFTVPSFEDDPGFHVTELAAPAGNLRMSQHFNRIWTTGFRKNIDFQFGFSQGAESFGKIVLGNRAKRQIEYVANTPGTNQFLRFPDFCSRPFQTQGEMPTRLPSFESNITTPQYYGGKGSHDRAA